MNCFNSEPSAHPHKGYPKIWLDLKKDNFQETQKFNPLERIQSPPTVDTSMWFEFNVKHSLDLINTIGTNWDSIYSVYK